MAVVGTRLRCSNGVGLTGTADADPDVRLTGLATRYVRTRRPDRRGRRRGTSPEGISGGG